MERSQKVEFGKEFSKKLSDAKISIFADFKGLTSVKADLLRRSLRAQKAEVKVIKNNVTRIVAKGKEFSADVKSVMDGLVGPTLVVWSKDDVAAVAKVVSEFAKDNQALMIKDSLLGTRKISPQEIEVLAKLPSREVLLAQLMGTLNAPIQSFVNVLAAVPRGLLNVLKAIETKKSEGSEVTN